jgi:signal transduction histidine kinase
MEAALQNIVNSAERAGVLVRNLQSLVKMEATREMLSPEVPLREALQLLEFELRKGKVTLVEEGLKSLAPLRLNRVEIGQAFLNIVLNAIQAMEPKGGELRISVIREGGMVGVRFIDHGAGIPVENLPRVFEPLFTTKLGQGSGIGLSVSKRIIENHGGRITVTSEAGKGAEFTTWLPMTTN